MKIKMTKSYSVFEIYDEIEINKEDYPELNGLSDEEALEYLNENLHEFKLNGGYEDSLSSEFEFNTELLK